MRHRWNSTIPTLRRKRLCKIAIGVTLKSFVPWDKRWKRIRYRPSNLKLTAGFTFYTVKSPLLKPGKRRLVDWFVIFFSERARGPLPKTVRRSRFVIRPKKFSNTVGRD